MLCVIVNAMCMEYIHVNIGYLPKNDQEASQTWKVFPSLLDSHGHTKFASMWEPYEHLQERYENYKSNKSPHVYVFLLIISNGRYR